MLLTKLGLVKELKRPFDRNAGVERQLVSCIEDWEIRNRQWLVLNNMSAALVRLIMEKLTADLCHVQLNCEHTCALGPRQNIATLWHHDMANRK